MWPNKHHVRTAGRPVARRIIISVGDGLADGLTDGLPDGPDGRTGKRTDRRSNEGILIYFSTNCT